MRGGNEQDDEEFEMLLGEIPTATSAGNLHSDESGIISSSPSFIVAPLNDQAIRKTSHSDAFTNSYHASQSSKHGANAVSVSPVFVSPVSSGSFPCFYGALNQKTTFNQKTQNEETFNGANDIVKKGHQTPAEGVGQEASSLIIESTLPDDQSLTSALANLSLNAGANNIPNMEPSVLYKGFPYSGFSMEGQFSDQIEKSQSGLEVLGGAVPPSPNRVNSVNFVNSTLDPLEMFNTYGMRFPSLTNMNSMDKFNAEANREENAKLLKLNIHDIKKHKVDPRLPVEEFSNNFREQRHNLPIYSGPVQMSKGIHSFPVFPRVPVSGVEFPGAAYQQQYFVDAQGSPFVQSQEYGHSHTPVQHLNGTHMPWQHVDENRHRAMQQQCAYLHQLRNLGTVSHNQLRAPSNGAIGSLSKNCSQTYYELPVPHVEQPSQTLYWRDNALPQGFNQSNLMLLGGSHCRYYAQGFCGRGESCPFIHGQNQILRSGMPCSPNDLKDYDVLAKEAKPIYPEKILTRSHGAKPLNSLKPRSVSPNNLALCHAHSNGRILSNGHCHRNSSIRTAGSFPLSGQNSGGSSPDKSELHEARSRQLLKINSLDEIKGKIYTYAKDQHGCRFLQDMFQYGTREDARKIFVEIIDHIVELMTDPFGNYLVQKLLDVCTANQRMEVVRAVTKTPGDLAQISLDMHGTRAVQKVIETVDTPEQIVMVVSSLKDGVVKLMKDLNGNHVAQRCLQYFDNKYNEFLFDAAVANCVEISTHRHGCCVMQKCLTFSDGEPRRRLVCEIGVHALMLSQDQFGNYVVQFVFDLDLPWANSHVMDQLEGNFACLSIQKFSSNVVEKCFKCAAEEASARIIPELMADSRFPQLLQDPYANYVVQSALNNSKGPIHAALVNAIKPHAPALRSSPYGKRILSCTSLKTNKIS
ncbi:uncharacterized protein LOC116245690 [Nymphaea colorata]|nr:uncharacterized protein LOC116245690 [Nymphaea colorata]